MRLSAQNTEVVRQRPQSTKLYLSIFQPQIVFKARINDSTISKGARTITYDSVSFGSHASLVPNATLWVGSVEEGKDIGKIRIRSATASAITVSENENIEWGDNQFLTGFYFIELWPIYPRIIANSDDTATFFKDFDEVYVNQNSILGTFVNAGPHRAAFVGDQLYYSSTGTHNLLGSSLSYAWAFEGGSPSSSTSANPGYVTYNTPGHFVTRLQISGSNGASDTTYRYVSIYNRIGQGSNTPVLKWEIVSLSGSRDEGGYKASFRVHEEVAIQENSIVVLFSDDDWYGNTNQAFGGNYPNAEKIFFVGHILEDSIFYDYQHSFVEFSAASLTQVMKEALGFSVSVESVNNPDVWYELLDMDCRRAIYHYLRWHTTALQIGDFQFVGTDYKIQFFDADRNSMYDAIDSLMRGTLIGKVVSDRQGKTWMEVDARAYPNPTGSFPSVMNISKRDYLGRPSIEERLSDNLSYLEYGGIAYSGVYTGTFSPILGSAPGNTPSFRGRIETIEGLALGSQAQLNQLVGNVWANENSKYPRITMDMAISARNLDIAPQESANIIVPVTDTVRGVAVQGLYIPDDINWKYDPKNSILLPVVIFKNLVNGTNGQSITISIPDEAIGTGFDVPGLQIPPLPIITVPPSLQQIINNAVIGAGGEVQYGIRWYDAFDPFSNIDVSNDVTILDALAQHQITMVVTVAGVYSVSAKYAHNGTVAAGEILAVGIIVNETAVASGGGMQLASSNISSAAATWSGLVVIHAGQSITVTGTPTSGSVASIAKLELSIHRVASFL